jgi:hypothetical protein
MFPQASARTRSVYGTTCSRRESCAYLQQIPMEDSVHSKALAMVSTFSIVSASNLNIF